MRILYHDPTIQNYHFSRNVLVARFSSNAELFLHPNGSDGWTRTGNTRVNSAVHYHCATSDWLRESDSNRRPAAYEAAAGNHSSQSRLFANQYINLNAFHPKTLHISHFFFLRLPLREPSMANDAHSPRRNPELPRDFHRGASARSTGLEDRPRAIRTTPANHGART